MKLEILPAKKGDCMFLHCGSDDDTGLILIDGGPPGVWENSLKPRLEELRSDLPDDEPLVIDLLIVSHVDQDHIFGIIKLLEWMVENEASPPVRIKRLWHNSFDHILDNDEIGPSSSGGTSVLASIEADAAPLVENAENGEERDAALVLASIKQGDTLLRLAKRLDILVNSPFPNLVIYDDAVTTATVKDVSLKVIGPEKAELIKLQAKFDTWLRAQPSNPPTASILAALTDNSAANLSSIIVLADDDDRKFLLTGDGRSDKILHGLDRAGMLSSEDKMHVDILKSMHHGSEHNVDDVFSRDITGGAYVFSGNGEHGNPERKTIEMLIAERPGDEMTLIFTYPLADIDHEREADHIKEQNKREGRGKPRGPDWDAGTDALVTLLDPPPDGISVETLNGAPKTF